MKLLEEQEVAAGKKTYGLEPRRQWGGGVLRLFEIHMPQMPCKDLKNLKLPFWNLVLCFGNDSALLSSHFSALEWNVFSAPDSVLQVYGLFILCM